MRGSLAGAEHGPDTTHVDVRRAASVNKSVNAPPPRTEQLLIRPGSARVRYHKRQNDYLQNRKANARDLG